MAKKILITKNLKTPPAASEVIKLAVLAVGGQGGGVLTKWISDLAVKGGYDVQMTSVAGVAQRTGATIYYVEMAPKSDKKPIFALSPSPGDLDVMIAAELMEAGRAVLRGFVTPDRTTLIASTHRILAVSEKAVPGDGRSDSQTVESEITKAALKLVCFDMEELAAKAGSMISASLFGGLARSGALPFDVSLYEEVIKTSGRGVKQSLAAFSGALNYQDGQEKAPDTSKKINVTGPAKLKSEWESLNQTVGTLPKECREMALAGLKKTIDFQDVDYGKSYLSHLRELIQTDSPDHKYKLSITGAKYIANAMCYDDLIRVADLKTRSSRNERLHKEQEASLDQIVHVTEYFHPRAQEICGTLPASMGTWIENSPKAFALLDRIVNKGRRIRTDGVLGFGMLWITSSIKPMRRKLLRHKQEEIHLNTLLSTVTSTVNDDYELAVEIMACQRLVKGYSDTHMRSHSKIKKVLGALELLNGREDAADWIRRLRNVALEDENGDALDGALDTIASFAA